MRHVLVCLHVFARTLGSVGHAHTHKHHRWVLFSTAGDSSCCCGNLVFLFFRCLSWREAQSCTHTISQHPLSVNVVSAYFCSWYCRCCRCIFSCTIFQMPFLFRCCEANIAQAAPAQAKMGSKAHGTAAQNPLLNILAAILPYFTRDVASTSCSSFFNRRERSC